MELVETEYLKHVGVFKTFIGWLGVNLLIELEICRTDISFGCLHRGVFTQWSMNHLRLIFRKHAFGTITLIGWYHMF
jgi:hypothetical protein